MTITCHIFECNALHYNYVMRKNCPLQITFHYFENVIYYNYITITITITPGLYGKCDKHSQPFARHAKQTVSLSLVRISWTRIRVNPRSLLISQGLVQHKRRLYPLYITYIWLKPLPSAFFCRNVF